MALLALVHIPDHTAGPITEDSPIAALADGIPGAMVVGVYEFPNRSELKCMGNCVRKGSGAWSRHKNGYMKCSICGSRNKNVRRWLVGGLFDWLGANLLGNDAPALFRTPEGYGPPR